MTGGRFVITGSGRCGTKWISRALTAACVPTGHEQVYSHENRGAWPEGLRGESSWMAATMLGVVREPVALLTRHPLTVVASWAEIGFFRRDRGNPTHAPLRAFAPEVYTYHAARDQALAMWIILNRVAMRRAELIVQLEQMPGQLPAVVEWAHGDPASPAVAEALQTPRCNRHAESRELTGYQYAPAWHHFDRRLIGPGRGLAQTLGYDPDSIPAS